MARQIDIIDIETWRDVPGFEDAYQVSSHGRIMRLPRIVPSRAGSFAMKDGLILHGKSPKHTRGGYLEATLVDRNGRQHRKGAHGWVCLTFHGPRPSPEHIVAHYDGNPRNNHYRNLRWATQAENADDRKRHGNNLEGRRHPKAKLTEAQVLEIRANYVGGYGDLARLARKYGVTNGLILNVIKRKTWKHI
jgi:hypothetical protein